MVNGKTQDSEDDMKVFEKALRIFKLCKAGATLESATPLKPAREKVVIKYLTTIKGENNNIKHKRRA